MKQIRMRPHDAEVTIKVDKEAAHAYANMYLVGGVRFRNPDNQDQAFGVLLLVDEQTALGKHEPPHDMEGAVHYAMHHLMDMVFVDDVRPAKAKEN